RRRLAPAARPGPAAVTARAGRRRTGTLDRRMTRSAAGGGPSIAVVGAGIGGLTVAATLRGAGLDVQVYEQASRFARIGAGIQITPNAMRVLRGIGLEDHLVAIAFRPTEMRNREWDSGELTFELPLG